MDGIEQSLGKKIIALRKENKLSQKDLAKLLDVSRQTIYKWESDIIRPTPEKKIELSKIFGVSATYFFDNANDIDEYINKEVSADAKQVEKEVASTKHKKRSKILIIGLSILLGLCLIFCAICGYIYFSYSTSGNNILESQHTFSIGFKPLDAFIVFAVIFAILLGITLYLVIKSHKKS